MKTLSSDSQRIYGQPMFKLLARANELEAQGKKIIHLEIGETNFDTPIEVTDAVINALDGGKTHYVPSVGIPELRDAICDFTAKEYGFRPYREQVLVCPGNAVIYFTVRCLVDRGMDVIYPDPGFSTWLSAIALCRANAIPVQLRECNSFRLQAKDIDNFISEYTRLIIVHSPSNPTGAVMTEDEIQAVYNVAKENDLYLLSDEAYAQLIYDGEHYSPSVYDKCQERTILLGSFSKAYAMTGWRLGYCIAPVEVIEKMGLLFQTIFSCFPPFIQWAGITALKEAGYYNQMMVKHFKRCRDLIVDGLNSIEGIKCCKPQGATYVFPNIQGTGLSDHEFADLMLEKAGVALLAGRYFGKYGEGHVRLCFANSERNIIQAIQNMKEVLNDSRRTVSRNIESYASPLC